MNPTHPAASSGVFARADSVFLKPAPIEPSWILSGNPQARSGIHSQGADAGAFTTVWDCSAGTFNWHFGWDETVVIVEGSVKVTSPHGETTVLNVGDVGYFPAGTKWKWEVEHYVRKIAFNRRPASPAEQLFRSAKQKIRSNRLAIQIGIAVATAAAVAVYALDLA